MTLFLFYVLKNISSFLAVAVHQILKNTFLNNVSF